MKRRIYFLAPLTVIAVILLTAFGEPNKKKPSTTCGTDNPDYSGGAPAGYTGSPGDGHNCTSCHGGSATTLSGVITSNVPSQGYTPGNSYTITVNLTGSGSKGFEVSPQDVAGSLLGTLTAGTGNKLVGSGKYCTHSSPVGGSSATWNFTWVAPVAGTGTVTFYGAFVITQPVVKVSTLDVSENVVTPLSVDATANPGIVCSGQSSQLNVTASGGSGSYTYSWTSIPPGFTSTLQNPVVYPTVSTQYISVVNDGTQTLTDTTAVSVTVPPTASAGADTTVCVIVTSITLNGTATGYSSVSWTTNGDGTFSNTSSLNTNYLPGSADKSSGSVHLTLTASPQSPCIDPLSSTKVVLFDPCGVGTGRLTGASFTTSVMPNPSSGVIIIKGTDTGNEPLKISVLDLNGKTLRHENSIVTGNVLDYRMDLSTLAKGMYFIRIESTTGIKLHKLVLQ